MKLKTILFQINKKWQNKKENNKNNEKEIKQKVKIRKYNE